MASSTAVTTTITGVLYVVLVKIILVVEMLRSSDEVAKIISTEVLGALPKTIVYVLVTPPSVTASVVVERFTEGESLSMMVRVCVEVDPSNPPCAFDREIIMVSFPSMSASSAI